MKFRLNLKIYPIEAVLNACYEFIDRAYVYLENPSENIITVSLNGKNKISKKQLKKLKGEFMNELLHCSLRYKISKNNKKIREYIIGCALYTSILSSPSEQVLEEEKLTYQEDPLGIAIPWEEKYGKNKKEAAA